MHFEVVDLAAPPQTIGIFVDGEKVADGLLRDDRVVAPVREIAEALGRKVRLRLGTGEIEIQTAKGGGLR